MQIITCLVLFHETIVILDQKNDRIFYFEIVYYQDANFIYIKFDNAMRKITTEHKQTNQTRVYLFPKSKENRG